MVGDLVKIVWRDSRGIGDLRERMESIPDKDYLCTSVGYLARDGEKMKVLVPHVSHGGDDVLDIEHCCGHMAIPTSAIVEMVGLSGFITIRPKRGRVFFYGLEVDTRYSEQEAENG